jgi:hypothetical protein
MARPGPNTPRNTPLTLGAATIRARVANRFALGTAAGAVALAAAAAWMAAACGTADPRVAARPRGTAVSRSQPAASSASPQITLPEMLVVEIPERGADAISPDAPPLSDLLRAASAGPLVVGHDRLGRLPIGATRVTWTARPPDAPGGAGAPTATRSAYVYVLPFGQIPIGISGDDHATAGNHGSKVARDESGRIHVAWLDGGRPGKGHRVMYRRGLADSRTNTVVWETDPTRVSDGRSEVWNSYVAMEANARAVHLAWWGGRTTKYRRLDRATDGWRWGPVQDIGVPGAGDDTGPDLAVRGDDEIHVVTPSGAYGVSRDRGATWLRDRVPTPPGRFKPPAFALDGEGNAHVVFTSIVRAREQQPSASRPKNGYWELRYVRRQAAGGWVDGHNALAAFPEWRDRGSGYDILADWPDVAVDRRGNIHIVWHGTVNTHTYGKDEAFYARRPRAGDGTWGPWEAPQALLRFEGKPTVLSYAPSLAVDPVEDLVVPVFFADVASGKFGSMFRAVRAGRIEGAPVMLSTTATDVVARGRPDDALSVWFPCPGSQLTRVAGRVWLDVLQTAATPASHASPHIVVYQSVDVTDLARRTAAHARASSCCRP